MSGFDNCANVIAAVRRYKKAQSHTIWDVYAEASPFKAERSKVCGACKRVAKSESETLKVHAFPAYEVQVELPLREAMEDDGDGALGDGYIKFVSMNKYTLKLPFGTEALAFLDWTNEHADECIQISTWGGSIDSITNRSRSILQTGSV